MASNFNKVVGRGLLLAGIVVVVLSWTPQAWAKTPKERYFQAEACYKALRTQPGKQTLRANWLMCIRQYQEVQKRDPSGPWAAAGLYMSGQLWEELARISMAAKDRSEAMDAYSRVVKRYPRSRYRSRSQTAMERLISSSQAGSGVASEPAPAPKNWSSLKTRTRTKTTENRAEGQVQTEVVKARSTPEKHVSSPAATSGPGGQGTTVTGLRYWSNPNYTRVVIDTNGPTRFRSHLLKKDPELNKPQRLFVDLEHCRLETGVQKRIPINDDLLINARAAQYNPQKVRVVVDIKTIENHEIFALNNPFRIVIDIRGTTSGKNAGKSAAGKDMATRSDGSRRKIGDLAKQLALGVERIVIDPGHGGRDPGALGYLKGVQEKQITLALAKRLARRMRETIGCEVLLTRGDDRYLTLEERTARANTMGADLFISLHTNAHKDPAAYGVETYFLNFATSDEAVLVAARENATSTKNISDLQTILSELMQNAKINESSRLADYVQDATCGHLRKNYSHINDKGVKQAPFYVLLGAHMPSILVEAAFISNPRECKRLMSPEYQEALCQGIVNGVSRYIRETAPMARNLMEQSSSPTL